MVFRMTGTARWPADCISSGVRTVSVRPWLIAIAIIAVLVVAGTFIGIARYWPFSPSAVTQRLESAFSRDVRIGQFREKWFPPGCEVEDIQFLHRKRKDLPPLITARRVVITAGWTGLLHNHIDSVVITGLHVTVPPADASGSTPVAPVKGSQSNAPSVGEIKAEKAELTFISHVPGTPPVTMDVQHLLLDHVGAGPVRFRTSLRFTKPSGEIKSQGQLGPWNNDDPARTPVSGEYRFENADLKVFHGLRGILSAQGRFNGNLSSVETAGSLDVPQFHVDGGAHSVHLTTSYRATVAAETADTVLDSVEARVNRTTILAHGTVAGRNGQRGKTATVEMAIRTGRVEDLLNYFSSEQRASMTGAVALNMHVELPPGDGFLKKVEATGDVRIAGAVFTNIQRQEPVNRLSESAAGENKKQQETDPQTVSASLKGHVVAVHGVAQLSNVLFEFPGSTARMNGTFNLLEKIVDIHGKLVTDGKLPDTTSGLKAVLLKVATPFMKKKQTTVVPFAIKGSASNPSIGLDLSVH